MKVSELKVLIEEHLKEYGDTEVFIYADHGQTVAGVYQASKTNIITCPCNELDWIDDEDLVDYPEAKKALLITD